MSKRGGLSKREREYIASHVESMAVPEIARRLDRSIGTIQEFISKGKAQISGELQNEMKAAVRAELKDTMLWKSLRKELTDDEIKFFEEQYTHILQQFNDDVVSTERIQVFSLIKHMILQRRNMIERKKAMEEIDRLEKSMKDLYNNFQGDVSKMTQDDRNFLSNLEQSLTINKAAVQSRTTEYTKLEEKIQDLMKAIKGTRDQRINKDVGKVNFLQLIKDLNQREIKEKEGRFMELMRIAADKEYARLGQPHVYLDGKEDLPILSAETVEALEQNQKETKCD